MIVVTAIRSNRPLKVEVVPDVILEVSVSTGVISLVIVSVTMLNPQFPVFIPVSTKVFQACDKDCIQHQSCSFDECPGCPVGNNVEIIEEVSEQSHTKN
jgi:hypothetical protein